MSLEPDLHSLVRRYELTPDPPTADIDTKSGTLIARYEVRRVHNVQNLGSKLEYYVICSTRISIAAAPPPLGTNTGYSDYPICLTHQQTLACGGGDPPSFSVRDFSPKTLNSSIAENASTSVVQQTTSTNEHISGSSTAQTNSFDTNVGVGFFGASPTGSAGGGYSHASTSQHDESSARGASTGTSADASTGESITVKEWAGYGAIDGQRRSVTWLWTQEYPWNYLEYNTQPKGASSIALPDYVARRMCALQGGSTVYMARPPSALSLFGIDFLMKSVWEIEAAAATSLVFGHAVTWTRGTHSVTTTTAEKHNDPQPHVTATASSYATTIRAPALTLEDLSLLALDPVRGESRALGAVTAFGTHQFLVAPAAGAGFLIVSGANNLHVRGSGFDDKMEADLSDGKTATFTVSFKVTDHEHDYALHLRHWKTGDPSVQLAIAINAPAAPTALEKHVDAEKSHGADRNELIVELRDQSFDSDNFHDYLVVGLNTVTVTVSSPGKTRYKLAGVAIGLLA